MILGRRASASLITGLLVAVSMLLVSRTSIALAQSPIYNGYPAYPYPYTSYLPAPFFNNTPNSSTPITTSNPLGSTTFIPAPIVPVQAPPQVVVQLTGSYCSVGDEQIYVPTGASPADYGCTSSSPSSPSPSSSGSS